MAFGMMIIPLFFCMYEKKGVKSKDVVFFGKKTKMNLHQVFMYRNQCLPICLGYGKFKLFMMSTNSSIVFVSLGLNFFSSATLVSSMPLSECANVCMKKKKKNK